MQGCKGEALCHEFTAGGTENKLITIACIRFGSRATRDRPNEGISHLLSGGVRVEGVGASAALGNSNVKCIQVEETK